jgi:hypothetical protein
MIAPTSHRNPHYRHYGSTKLRTKGWGPFRYDWFHICSAHQGYDAECGLCQIGGWMNHWKWWLGHILYKLFPDVWKWLANRKH